MSVVEVVSTAIDAEVPISIIVFVDADATFVELLDLFIYRCDVTF